MKSELFFIFLISVASSIPVEQRQTNSTKSGKIKPRIVGGETTFLNEFPFMVNIKNLFRDTICGGALINENFVVTAAHCVDGIPLQYLYIYLGDYDAKDDYETSHVEVKITSAVIHPGYSISRRANDIAVLKLSSAVTFTKAISSVCLAMNDGVDYSGWFATVCGWGRTQFKGESASILQKLRLTVLSNSFCQSFYWPVQVIEQSHICAHEQNKDACNGDSGGPFVVSKKGKAVLIGVVSFGVECGTQNKPTVFARVSSYVNWIQSNIEGTGICLA